MFVYELMEVEEGAQVARVVIDVMSSESLDNLINDPRMRWTASSHVLSFYLH